MLQPMLKHMFQRDPWRSRDLRYAALGRTVSTLGDEVALVALLLAAYGTGGGPPAIAALLLAGALPTVLLAPWAGRLVDRTDSRRLLVGTGAVQTALSVGLAVAGPFAVVLVLVAALSATQVAAGPAWQALIPRIVGESHVGRVLGVFQSAALLAGLTGAAVGGLIVSVAGTRWALLLDAVTFAALTATAVAIRTRRTPPTSIPDAAPARLLDGWRHLRTDPLVAPLFMGLLAFVVAGEITNVVEVLLVTDVLGGGAVAFGMLGAVFGLAAAGGAALGSRCTSDTARARTAVYAATVLAAMLITVGLAPNLLALAATWTVAGLALGALNIATSTLLVTRTPDERRGQVLATAQGLSRGCSLGATALGGLLGAALGPRPTFVWAGAAALLVALILGLRVRKSLHSTRTSVPSA